MSTDTHVTNLDASSAENDSQFPQMLSRRFLAQAALLALLTVVSYLPALRAGYVWDDDDHLTANVAVASPHGLHMIWSSLSMSRYYPLTLTTFWFEHKLWGYSPLPYHLVNILLHAASAVLVFILLNALDVRGAWVAAALWSVHPVNAESVAWITELKNVQSGFLYFLSLLCWLRFRMQRRSGWYWLALLVFGGALISKPSTVVLPLVLILLAWWRRERWTTPDFLRLIPFVALSCGMSVLAIVEQRGNIGRSGLQEWSLSIPQRLILAVRDIWFYAEKVLWPAHLNFVYPRWEINMQSPSFFLPLVASAAVALFWWIYRRRPAGRASAFGLGYFVIALLPILGFVNVFYFRYSYVADHFQYLADIGIIALAVGTLTSVTRPSTVRSAVAGLVIAAFGVLSWQRCEAFHDEETLWRDTLVENPGCWMAWNNLGLLREQAHDVDEAVACYERALQAKPDSADAHIDLANLLSRAGHLQDAMGQYEEALRIEPRRADTHYDMGLAFDQAGRLHDAIAQYDDALRIRPNYAEAENNLGNALRQNGQDSDALPHFEAALKIAPEFPEAHNNLAVLLASQGRTAEAIAHYRNALEIQPDYIKALNNLARLLATDDAIAPEERAAAVPLAERACQLTNYRQPVLLNTLAAAYAAVGRFREAIRIAQQAIVLANSSGQKKLVEDIEARLGLYKANRPFRQGQTIVPP